MTIPMPNYRIVTASVLLMAYLGLAAYLLWLLYHPLANAKPPEWNNVLVIFNAIGALATAAVGVLLGVEVQQGNVDSARRSAEQKAAEVERKTAEIARKDGAIIAALGSLDAAAPAAAGAARQPGVASARATLLAALAAPPANE